MRRAAFGPRTRLVTALSLALLLSLVIPLLLPAPALAASQVIGLSSGTFEFNVAEGQRGRGELTVFSDSSEPLKVLVYAANQTISPSGTVDFALPSQDPGKFLENPAAWLQVSLPAESKSYGNIPYLDLAPKQRIPVSFSFEVPAGVPPGDHQILLFFETFSFPSEATATVSSVRGRLGARIRVRVQGQFVERLDVEPFVVPQVVVGSSMPYSFVLRNGGNIDKTIEARIEVLNRNDEKVSGEPVLSERTVFAQSMMSQEGSIGVAGLPPGLYTARVDVDFQREAAGGTPVADRVRKERTFWVVPLWLLIAVAAVLFIVLAWILWRFSVRLAMRRLRRERAAAGQAGDTGAVPEDGQGSTV